MADAVRRALVAAILLCLASDTNSAVQRVNVPGTAEFIDGGSCDTNIPKQEFINQLAARIEGINASVISITAVKCAANLNGTIVEWSIMMAPGVGPTNQQVIDRLRGFRDDDDARWTMFVGLNAAGFKAKTVDFSIAMWKCTESMDCTSLTGWSGTNYVYLTLGFNVTDPTPVPVTTPAPKVVCPMAMLWVLEDLADDVPCEAQLALFFGGIAFIVIFCPACCWFCRHRERRLLANLCAMMDPEHLGTGSEAHRAYWWTALSATAEDIKGIPPVEANTKITNEQIHLLLKERHMSEEDEGDSLILLLRGLEEQGYITKVDPSLPIVEVRESNDEGEAKATTLYERAVTQKGALAWDKSLIPAYGTPFYEDGTELEFYSIRNVCWLLGTLRIFAAEVSPRGQDAEAGLRRDTLGGDAGLQSIQAGLEKKIMYGIELQLDEHKESNCEAATSPRSPNVAKAGTPRSNVAKAGSPWSNSEPTSPRSNVATPPQWRYNIGMEQLRLPIVQGETVEVCGPDGIWIAATVVGPRLVHRVDLGHNTFRQQLGYCLKATNSGQLMKSMPAERVRRLYIDQADGTTDGLTHVEYYESARGGWMPALLVEGILLDEGNASRDKTLQPWVMYGTHSNNKASTILRETSEMMSKASSYANRDNSNPDGSLASAKSNTAATSWHIAVRHANAGVLGTAPKQNSNRQSQAGSTLSTNGAADIEKGNSKGSMRPMTLAEESRVNIWTHAQIKLDADRHESSLGIPVSTCRLRSAMSGRRSKWI